MSEKRFVVVDYETIKDTKTGEEFEWTLFVAFFNELAEENEQLRNIIKQKEEEEKLYAKEILRLNELDKQKNQLNDILGGY